MRIARPRGIEEPLWHCGQFATEGDSLIFTTHCEKVTVGGTKRIYGMFSCLAAWQKLPHASEMSVSGRIRGDSPLLDIAPGFFHLLHAH